MNHLRFWLIITPGIERVGHPPPISVLETDRSAGILQVGGIGHWASPISKPTLATEGLASRSRDSTHERNETISRLAHTPNLQFLNGTHNDPKLREMRSPNDPKALPK